MLKQLIALFNLISFIIISAVLPADVKIDTKLPEGNEFIRDSTYVIEITIAKGDVFGFAKFQQNLPPGFEAQAGQTEDASFTFADGKVKFIWMALPEKPEIKISYAITATASAAETGIIEGKFSYIEDNERKSFDIPNTVIKVINKQPVAEVEAGPAVVSVTRSVKDLGNMEYQVDLVVEKQGITGFAKLEEYLPEDGEATVIENKQSVFSQVDEKAKFVWMSVPSEPTLNISYTVKSSVPILEALGSMEGNFSYLDGNETKTIAVTGTEGAVVQEPVLAEAETTTTTPLVPETTAVETPEPLIQEEPVLTAAIKEEPAPVQTTVPKPETGVTYKVQVVAGHKLVTEAFLRETYKFQEPYNVENHEGWIKYTTGMFDMYRGARDKRESLVQASHNFPGPFVTAYNAGERITVQEALMITNQQWFK